MDQPDQPHQPHQPGQSNPPRAARFSHLFVHVRDLEESVRFWTEVVGLDLLLEHPGYARVGGHGVAFAGPPEPQDWGAVHAWFTDPNGYRCSIYQA